MAFGVVQLLLQKFGQNVSFDDVPPQVQPTMDAQAAVLGHYTPLVLLVQQLTSNSKMPQAPLFLVLSRG